MIELMALVVRLIRVRAEIATFEKPQLYMLKEAEELEKEINKLAYKLEVLK